MFLKEGVEVISFGGSVQKRVLTGFGVEKAAHGIELTEVKSENFHSTSLHGLFIWLNVWQRTLQLTAPAGNNSMSKPSMLAVRNDATVARSTLCLHFVNYVASLVNRVTTFESRTNCDTCSLMENWHPTILACYAAPRRETFFHHRYLESIRSGQ
ncbi:MAG: hypothetical protein ACK480_07780 [Planctomycetota bacterium]